MWPNEDALYEIMMPAVLSGRALLFTAGMRMDRRAGSIARGGGARPAVHVSCARVLSCYGCCGLTYRDLLLSPSTAMLTRDGWAMRLWSFPCGAPCGASVTLALSARWSLTARDPRALSGFGPAVVGSEHPCTRWLWRDAQSGASLQLYVFLVALTGMPCRPLRASRSAA